MIVFCKTLICYGFLIVFSFFSHSALCDELVGVLPFANQRYQQQDDWLGYYIQARIKNNLGSNSDWKFHPQSVLRLWALRTEQSRSISPLNTILIEGSFQQVVGLGYISLRVKRNIPGKEITENLEISYSADNLDNQIDRLSKKVGVWIQPDFKLKIRTDFPRKDLPGMKEIFMLRQRMFSLGDPPDIRAILHLEEIVDEGSPPEMIADLAVGMLVVSQFLEGKEQKSLLKKTELFLRKAILKNKKSARLYSLLAENYYLSGNYVSWVEKTAEDAIRIDPQNELGFILKVIVNDSDDETRKKDVEQIKQLNPWLFSKAVNGGNLFQKGILKNELSRMEIPLK
ncbi:MAG: hypothetical protein HN580_13465 [Deltaproteobacteria bacterium]|jgi:hypothetical protein|nr:hypothetical protein [Deltaproteobacteria bacterium]MBT4263948.1 hypothetical protein [Deltaproteobacteria bacterium]MBT4639891.1 hypothetical protein [Deltaproteobacteria bacterium]MBT6498503.1 hypothetical protein [Deltaproteobacteria bacterium]MBT6612733.1 hypothetical protein [Deltaproteobacteria bacterium]